MAKFLVALVILVVALGFSDAFPSRFNRHNLKPRSISEKLEGGPQGLEGPKSNKEALEGLDKDQIPKDLLNAPKGLRGGDDEEGYRRSRGGDRPIEEGFGEDGPKGIPKYGPRGGPEALPGPFGGPESGLEGLNFGPEGPCMSKRCNPFRRRRPSYRAYLRDLRKGRYSGPPGGFGPDGPMGPPLPVMTEIIIIRKVPIVLSKLIVAVLAHPEKFQKPGGEKPGYDKPELEKPGYEKPGYEKPGKEPVGPPDAQYGYGSNEDVLLQDAPKKKEGLGESKVDYEEGPKSKYQQEGPKKEGSESKDKDFDESMGEEVQLSGRSYGGEGPKDKKSEGKGPEGKDSELKTLQSEKKEETKLKYNEKEYLEKPEVGVPSKAELEAGNELEPRGNELDKEKEQLRNKLKY